MHLERGAAIKGSIPELEPYGAALYTIQQLKKFLILQTILRYLIKTVDRFRNN